ncbi:uncharacterized protein PHACADRAFT_255241 [Phanerochaete carnosa HHB-10118-sp]|uniref:Uncharacterized protein n=1 Tax=Phanerochaete carnosa (strain HHB-10118-sp) TaxID=650164 RepID=K5VU04_PHACS|nr:uncharacterized protein PHACADRAFT_255241 [Phanerochaete carnosa HHB-10118-sp]EKM54983.1 hypothetical protein PHACADRAFT_255241 [Phanerochaete carnosa HHB-10118-sp]
MFYVRGPQGCGINCSDALDEQFAELQGPNDVIQCPPAVVLRVLWPDHEPWSASVHLNPSPTRAQLAKLVSFHAQTFVAETWAKPVTTDTRWKLGPGALTVPDLELVGLQPVTSQDWQVHFRVQQVTG